MSGYGGTDLTREQFDNEMTKGRASAIKKSSDVLKLIKPKIDFVNKMKTQLGSELYFKLKDDVRNNPHIDIETIVNNLLNPKKKEEKAPPKEKKPRKQSERCTMTQQNNYHDEMVMAKDENKQLLKYIKQLEKHIVKMEK
jgi:hypothetical protein